MPRNQVVLGTFLAALLGAAAFAACAVTGQTTGRPCSNGKCPSGLECVGGKCVSGSHDAGHAVDAGQPDAGLADAGQPDAGPLDAGPLDGGQTDGGLQLIEGHVGSGGGAVDDGTGLRLVDPGFEVGDRTCAGQTCEEGGIEP